MGSGTFITFEGGEGSGKTTLIEKLASALNQSGHSVLVTREPGGSELSEKVRNLLLDTNTTVDPTAELLLFLAARAQHIAEKIKPALDAGQIVLCDRFNDSTIVYQGVARNMGMHAIKRLTDQVTGDPKPSLTLYLDIDPEIGLKRATGTPDRMESEALDFHRLVREGYRALAEQEPERIITIDASETVDNVYNQALKAIETKLGGRV